MTDVELMVRVIWLEARGEGEAGMRGVGHVVKNRIGTAGFPKTLLGVLTEPNQFSSLNANDPEFGLQPEPGDCQYAFCQDIVPKILAGVDVDPTGGARFYANEKTMTSGWYVRNIVNSPAHPITVVIGKQTFRL